MSTFSDGYQEHLRVSQTFLDACAEQISCGTLNMHTPKKSRGKVIEWGGRTWIAISGRSQGLYHYQEVDLRECVLEEEYKGPPNNPEKSGNAFYTGGRFQFKGQTWVMTENEIRLVPEKKEKA